MEKEQKKKRFVRTQAINRLIDHHEGVAKFCEYYGINQRTLNVWKDDGIPSRFMADCLAIAASNPPLFDVLLNQAQSGEYAETA